MRDESDNKTFFEHEKNFLEHPNKIKFDAGDYVGEVDELGKPKNGALKVEKCPFLPNGFFVGKFGSDGLPLDGELRTPGYSVKLKTLDDGSRHLTQRSFEGGKITEFKYLDGKWQTLKTMALNGDLLSEKGNVVTKFNDEEISAKSVKLPMIIEIEEKFLPVKQAFEDLRENQQQKFLQYQQNLAEEGDVAISQKLSLLKESLQNKEILISGTIFAELTGVRSEDDQQRYAIVERGVGIKRGLEKPKEDESSLSQEELKKFGNCREYASQTQKIAIKSGLPNTFILFGSPDHVFNVAVEGNKMAVIDGWNGDLIYDFSPREFYQNQSLHAIFDLKIHKDTWLGADNPNGIARPLPENISRLEDLLEARIAVINEARFDPEIQDIIRTRVTEKINHLDPNDAYYHEGALELKHIINHFGLSSKLVDKMRDDYVAKFDPEKLVVGNEAYVIYDLFCRDSLKPEKEFEEIKEKFLGKITELEISKTNRFSSLIDGFEKISQREFSKTPSS
ncbi:MAG: hypothetical protein ACKOXJ_05970 [Alphaproteobacteria bacterium]